ncbi:hypothetical protein TNCV_1471681 [Trichonephila clavipes]|nr:hypothetical protein TNCV_1471681 [Trichonephila clavipes]
MVNATIRLIPRITSFSKLEHLHTMVRRFIAEDESIPLLSNPFPYYIILSGGDGELESIAVSLNGCDYSNCLSARALDMVWIEKETHSEGGVSMEVCQVIYSQFGLAIHQNDHQTRRRFVEWAQNEIAVVPDFHKRILFSVEAHFWLNGYVNKQKCRIWSEANSQVYVETPLHPEKLTVWCALWAGGILLQKR